MYFICKRQQYSGLCRNWDFAELLRNSPPGVRTKLTFLSTQISEINIKNGFNVYHKHSVFLFFISTHTL